MTTIYVDSRDTLPDLAKHELYPTERALIKCSVEIVPSAFRKNHQGLISILDPGAGDGRFGAIFAESFPCNNLTGVEFRDTNHQPGFDHWIQTDYTQAQADYMPPNGFDLIVGNPPYGPKKFFYPSKKNVDSGLSPHEQRLMFNQGGLTIQDSRHFKFVSTGELFIRQAFSQLAPNGVIIFLMRLAFQAGTFRSKYLWQTHAPIAVYPLANRPSFYGGGTNGTDYALFVWGKDSQGNNMGIGGQWPCQVIEYQKDEKEIRND